ncbi:MAG: hypothetical protein ACLVKA_04310 [Collinsella aerofaciens]
MVAGEFHFNVTNANDQADPAAVVATGTTPWTVRHLHRYRVHHRGAQQRCGSARHGNRAVITVTYTYTYNVSEDASRTTRASAHPGHAAHHRQGTDNRKAAPPRSTIPRRHGLQERPGTDGAPRYRLNGTKVLDVKSKQGARYRRQVHLRADRT